MSAHIVLSFLHFRFALKFSFRSAMEELSVRSNMALAQQEALDDMDNKLLRKAVVSWVFLE